MNQKLKETIISLDHSILHSFETEYMGRSWDVVVSKTENDQVLTSICDGERNIMVWHIDVGVGNHSLARAFIRLYFSALCEGKKLGRYEKILEFKSVLEIDEKEDYLLPTSINLP